MASNADCGDPKPGEASGDFFLSFERSLDYVLQEHKVLSQDLNHEPITDNFSVVTE